MRIPRLSPARLAAPLRSRPVALWLFAVAALVFAMVVVGGATRLTRSGLSITEWKPLLGVLPPLNQQDWMEAFRKYQAIPEYRAVNADMTLEGFKVIYWWEWSHRLLGRIVGVAFAVPAVFFWLTGRLPHTLRWRVLALFGLGALQGAVGWWMVSSGLVDRIDVAPERLTVHLGIALVLFIGLVWTGLDALFGPRVGRPDRGWRAIGLAFLGLVLTQCLLGAFVAGNDAGMVFTDWPRMNGAWWPPVEPGLGLRAFIHDKALVQFNHRLVAYLTLISALILFVALRMRSTAPVLRAQTAGIAVAVTLQAGLGILTLIHAAPLALGALHQAGAVIVLALAALLAWTLARTDAHHLAKRGRF